LSEAVASFCGDGTDLRDPKKAQPEIAALAAAMKESGAALRVVGFADRLGSNRRNMKLSQARVVGTVAVLIAQGFDSSKLVSVGRGDGSPIAAENGPDSRRNRRVVFELVPQAEQKN
jgi:OmpA-OmpF porin, OOP family